MQRVVEASGRTLEEAKNAAMRLLGVTDPSQVTFEQLPDKKGLFNFMYKRVRAIVGAPPEQAAGLEKPEEQPSSREQAVSAMQETERVKESTAVRRAQEPAPEEIQELLRVALGPDEDAPPVEVPEGAERDAIQLLNSILQAAEFQVEVQHLKTEGRYVHLGIFGQDVPHVIGRRGIVIDSLQYLVNVIFSKNYPGVRLVLDAEQYRMKRAMTLYKLALEVADQVANSGEEAELDPLPAHERRIVHRVLRDDQRVKTYSEGLEPDRRVVISPQTLPDN